MYKRLLKISSYTLKVHCQNAEQFCGSSTECKKGHHYVKILFYQRSCIIIVFCAYFLYTFAKVAIKDVIFFLHGCPLEKQLPLHHKDIIYVVINIRQLAYFKYVNKLTKILLKISKRSTQENDLKLTLNFASSTVLNLLTCNIQSY